MSQIFTEIEDLAVVVVVVVTGDVDEDGTATIKVPAPALKMEANLSRIPGDSEAENLVSKRNESIHDR